VKSEDSKISKLEDKLGQLAMEYRSAESTDSQRRAIASYSKVLNEVYALDDGWLGPDADSCLPEDLMPKAYLERKAKRIKSFKSKV